MSIYFLILLFLVILSGVCLAQQEERVIRTPQGLVKGYKEDDIFIFYGIPYATGPKGKDRFSAPLASPTWQDTFEAVDRGIICPQGTGLPFKNLTMQEDCLIANVFVPDTNVKKLPVVVYVHGGSYQIGYSNYRTYINLVKSKKLIAITFNYRLGVHGFLCLGTTDVPGNAGLKDQVALLKWVKRNIASYGGDPKDVTIAGYSAGSSSVDILMLSPSTRGLFNKVIAESGANIAVFSVQIDPLENAKIYAKSLGFDDVDNLYRLEEFYKTASYDLLTKETFMNRTDSVFVFTPCIERKTRAQNILTDSPYNILKSGEYEKVPMLYGFSEMEGLFRLPRFETWKHKMNEKFEEFLPADLKFDCDDDRHKVVDQIKTFYFEGKPVSDDNILSYINYFSDVLFTFPMIRAVKFHAEAGHREIYLYEYTYVDESAPVIPHTNNTRGANHCDQTLAISDGSMWLGPPDEENLSENYINMKALMRSIWISFITSGSPSSSGTTIPAWPSARANGSPFMSLGRTVSLEGGALLEPRMRFWHEIYDRYYRKPIPPTSTMYR
ncbi:hypothetical protein ACJJTC_010289 [Scirpophaga incertulas]